MQIKRTLLTVALIFNTAQLLSLQTPHQSNFLSAPQAKTLSIAAAVPAAILLYIAYKTNQHIDSLARLTIDDYDRLVFEAENQAAQLDAFYWHPQFRVHHHINWSKFYKAYCSNPEVGKLLQSLNSCFNTAYFSGSLLLSAATTSLFWSAVHDGSLKDYL